MAKWDDINFEEAIWALLAKNMKGKIGRKTMLVFLLKCRCALSRMLSRILG